MTFVRYFIDIISSSNSTTDQVAGATVTHILLTFSYDFH